MAQSQVGPLDSISNVSHKSRSSKAGSRASASSSEFRKAKAEKAALLARAAALKGKQALQLEEIKLKAKLEQMELGAEIAASTAKIKVLQNEGEDLDGVSQGDAMNDYYDEHGQGMEATATEEEFMQVGAIPKPHFREQSSADISPQEDLTGRSQEGTTIMT
ncbi:hypothetical protein DPEC_G00246880 [Dallia pectoralis]|uniref:Uncharacterized protein n=1 Tax=Dallia pectoralis TaxID=75939 RepID=A0ACC2FWN9_DALPE|nr:hypothetical protein DPEC_G00246880 [Dallia pectoralis]